MPEIDMSGCPCCIDCSCCNFQDGDTIDVTYSSNCSYWNGLTFTLTFSNGCFRTANASPWPHLPACWTRPPAMDLATSLCCPPQPGDPYQWYPPNIGSSSPVNAILSCDGNGTATATGLLLDGSPACPSTCLGSTTNITATFSNLVSSTNTQCCSCLCGDLNRELTVAGSSCLDGTYLAEGADCSARYDGGTFEILYECPDKMRLTGNGVTQWQTVVAGVATFTGDFCGAGSETITITVEACA